MSGSRAERDQPTLDDLLPAETDSPEATRALAGRIAEALRSPVVLALTGELGSGKTQFVKGFCAALGVDPSRVTSPTFTLVNEYHLDEHRRPDSDAPPIVHADAYRLEGEEEFAPLGIEEHLYGGGYCLIEWADRVAGILPSHTLYLRFEHAGERARRIGRAEPPRPE